MPLSTRLIALLAALALGLAVAACGGDDDDSSSGDVPADAIAVVGDREIPKTEYDRLLTQAQATYEAREQEFPEAGTPEFAQLRNALVRSLVEQAQFEIAAEELDVTVTDEELEKRLDELKQQFFDGDEQKYKEELEKQGLTEEQLREQIEAKLLSDKIYAAVTKKATVTEQEINAYYEQNKAQYEQPESREVRHILVKQKALADEIYAKLKNGADFAELAERYSEDTASKAEGGKFKAFKGKTVAPFDKFVFAADTGDLSKPIKTEFGWHVIEVLEDIKPPSAQPLSEVRDSINSTLLQEEQNKALQSWVADTKQKYDVVYAPGYAPAATTTQGANTGATTTG
jgi:foldase protein PrsA